MNVFEFRVLYAANEKELKELIALDSLLKTTARKHSLLITQMTKKLGLTESEIALLLKIAPEYLP